MREEPSNLNFEELKQLIEGWVCIEGDPPERENLQDKLDILERALESLRIECRCIENQLPLEIFIQGHARKDQKECPDGSYTVYAKFYTQWGRVSEVVSDSIVLTGIEPQVFVEQMTVEEIKAKIVEIQKKIIELLQQLIQLIQERIAQFQARLP